MNLTTINETRQQIINEIKQKTKNISTYLQNAETAVIDLNDVNRNLKGLPYDPTDRLIYPKVIIEPIEFNKIKYPFLNNKIKGELIQSYKDGILIKPTSLKKQDILDVALYKSLEAEHGLESMKATQLFNVKTFNVSKNQMSSQTFFYDATFDFWNKPEFKDNIYIIVEGFSKTNLIKFSLREFNDFSFVKEYILKKIKNGDSNNEDIIYGIDRDFYQTKLNDLSFTQRAANKVFENKEVYNKKILKISAIADFFDYYFNYRNSITSDSPIPFSLKPEMHENKIEFEKLKHAIFEHFYHIKTFEDGKLGMNIGNKHNAELVLKAIDYFFKITNSGSNNENCVELFQLLKEFGKLNQEDLCSIFFTFFKFNYADNESEEKAKENILSWFYMFFKSFGRMVFLGFKINGGDCLPDGRPIDVTNFTKMDAHLYWKSFWSMMFLYPQFIESHMVPLVFEDNKVLNTVDDIYQRFGLKRPEDDGVVKSPPLNKEDSEKINFVLSEALESSVGLIPNHNFIEMTGSMYRLKTEQSDIIKGARLFETDNLIFAFLHDENERYMIEILQKDSKQFIGIFQEFFRIGRFSQQDYEQFRDRIAKEIYNFLSTTIRDFKVSINRDVTLGPVRHRVPTGIKTNRKRIIYLPRIKYNQINDRTYLNDEIKTLRKNSGGFRNHYIRKLPQGAKASPLQITLARHQNIEVPIGSTYVRAHMFGNKEMSPAEIEYRSRKMTGSIYFCEEPVFKSHELLKMSWAGFEEHCRKIITRLGWEISTVRNVDEGIDIEAFKSVVDNEKEKVIRLFVQCKHWKNNIPPGVIRELLGAKELQNNDYLTELMVITSGSFSSGAIQVAKEKNVTLIDGADLTKL